MPNTSDFDPLKLRLLPSIDQLLRTETAAKLRGQVGSQRLTTLARTVTDQLRTELQSGTNGSITKESMLLEATQRLDDAANADLATGMRRVINATGVLIHTNLGRAPLSEAARQALAHDVSGYCTLEYDLTTGERGRRGGRVEDLLIELTGSEDALVVNNCAAAALLVLSVFADDGETIVSRGELVEIGGDFRVPDVMATSGTRMIEVGTTNRTKLEDYRKVLNEKTRLIMRVHPSNYRIVGFTSLPSLSELALLAHEHGVPLYEDAGSGALVDLTQFGLGDEPIIRESLASGVDLVTFSGDKLLGGCQAGLIVGRKEFVGRMRKHPLYRALRADKLALGVLEKTLNAYRRELAETDIPLLRMLSISAEEIRTRAEKVIEACVNSSSNELTVELVEGESAIGGGAGPNTHPRTFLIAIKHRLLSATELQERLRASNLPVICRVAEDRALLDLRTVAPEEDEQISQAVSSLSK